MVTTIAIMCYMIACTRPFLRTGEHGVNPNIIRKSHFFFIPKITAMRLNKHTNLNKGARGINEIDNGINNMALERVLRRCESGVMYPREDRHEKNSCLLEIREG